MQIATCNGTLVHYTEENVRLALCIEVVSACHALGQAALEAEVEALATAGLLFQLELGVPVIKLLNLTPLYEGESADLYPLLNYLGSMLGDPALSAGQVLSRTIERSDSAMQAAFVGAPTTFSRFDRFRRAVGIEADELQSPWIHASLDQSPELLRSLDEHVFALAPRPLWWGFSSLPEQARLYRPGRWSTNEETTSLPTIPLAFVRDTAAEASDGGTFRHVRRLPSSQVCGFSIRCDGVESMSSDHYAALLTNGMLSKVLTMLNAA